MTEEISRRFPATIELAIAAMLFAITLGVPLGFVAAKRHGSAVDHGSLVASLIGISIPVFFLAILLKYVFAVQLGWLPTIGRQDVLIDAEHPTGFYVLDGIITLNPEADLGRDRAPDPAGDRARLDPPRDRRPHHTRVGARRPERGLRADRPREGRRPTPRRQPPHLPERDAARGHDHRPPDGPAALGGDPHRDGVRDPGHGNWLAGAIESRDYPVLQGGILFVALVFVIVNLIVDISYALLDPRIRVS